MKTLFGPFTQILPMTGLPLGGHLKDDQLTVVEDGGVLVEDGRVIAIESFSQLKNQADETIQFESSTVAIPGLIDAHTHICWAGSRSHDYAKRLEGISYQQIASEGGGILSTVQATRSATKQELVENITRRLDRMLREGITTCEVKSGYGLSVDSEIKMLEAVQEAKRHTIELIPTCLAAHTLPSEYKTHEEYLNHLTQELLPALTERSLACRLDIFVEENAFPASAARPYLLAAKGMGLSLTIHADQFTRGGAQLAAEVEAVSADHLEVSRPEDALSLLEAGVSPIVLPGATLGLGLPFPPAKMLLDHGLPLVIASDWNPGSAPMGYLLQQAALLGAAEKLSMASTLAALTVRAAKALELPFHGKLDKGSFADLTLYPTQDWKEILYQQGGLKPIHVIKKGKQVL